MFFLFSFPKIFLRQLGRYFSKYCTSYERNGVVVITEGCNLLTILVYAEIIRSYPYTGCQHTIPVLYLGFAQEELKCRDVLEKATYSQGQEEEQCPHLWSYLVRWTGAEGQTTGLVLG